MTVAATTSNVQYGYTWMLNAVQSRQDAERAKSNPRDELKAYLDSPLERVDDVVCWWGVRVSVLRKYFELV